jgi:hypothetical protein
MDFQRRISTPFLDAAVSGRLREQEHNEDIKSKLLNDPTYSDQILSHLSRSAIPDEKLKKLPVGTTFEKAMSNIDTSDPRRKMLEQLQTDMPSIIKNAPYGTDPGTAIMQAVKQRSDAIREDTFKHIQANSGFFGKAVAPENGYEEWDKKNPGWSSPATNFAQGAGLELASIPVLAAASKYAAKPVVGVGLKLLGKLLSMGAPELGAGAGAIVGGPLGATIGGAAGSVLSAGLTFATAMAGIDAVKKIAANNDQPIGPLGELALSIPAFGGAGMLARKGGLALSKIAAKQALAREGSQLASLGALKGPADDFISGASKDVAGNYVARPAATVLHTREDEKAFMDAIQSHKRTTVPTEPIDSIAAKEASAIRMKRLGTLEEEDLNRIHVLGEDASTVTANRVKINIAKEAEELKLKTIETQDRILNHAEMLKENEGIDHATALLKAKEIIAPTAEQTIVHSKVLKNYGWADTELAEMSPKDIASQAEIVRKQVIAAKPPAVIDEVLPPAVMASKVKISNGDKLDIKWQGVTDDVKLLGEPTAQEIRIRGNANQTNTPKVIIPQTVGEGVDKVIDAHLTTAQEQLVALAKTKPGSKGIAQKIHAIQSAVYDQGQDISDTYGSLVVDKVNTMQKRMKSMVEEVYAKHGDALEQVAKDDIDDAVKVMASTSKTPIGELAQKKVVQRNLLAQQKAATKEFKSTFGDTTLKQVIDEQDPNKLEQLREWLDKHKGTFGKASVAGIGTIGALGAMSASPDEAEASPLTTLAKVSAEATGVTVEKAVKAIVDAGYGPTKISENGHAIENLGKFINFAPKDAGVFAKTKTNFLDKIFSPHIREEIHLNARYADGTRAPYGIAKAVGYASQVILDRTGASIRVVNNVLKDAGVESNLDDIAAHMQPLVDKYHKAVNLELPYWQGQEDVMNKVLTGAYKSDASSEMRNFSKTMRLIKGDAAKLTDPEDIAAYEMFNKRLTEAQDNIKGLQYTYDDFAKEHEQFAKAAAQKWSTARVALAVDGTGMEEGNAWLASMLTSAEKRAVAELTQLNQVYAADMKAGGHKVLTGSYMHHPAHPTVDYAADLKYVDSNFGGGDEAMRLVNFYHRGSGSKLMIPDTHYVYGKYLPDANKRIGISTLWKVGEQGGWDAVRKQMEARGGYDGALKLIDDVRTAFDPIDTIGSAKWLNRYAAFEVARLLTLSPSVSFKHGLKLMGNWTIFPAAESLKASGYNMGLQSRMLAQDLAGEAWKGKDNVTDLARALTSMHHTYAAVSDIAPYELPTNIFDKYLTKWNEIGSTFVSGVERLDRGQTFVSAMLMAQKKGMTPEQAMFGLMDSVLKVNFLTGPNNPKWLKDPFIRTMMMFQGTPFKILEQRLLITQQGGKDVANTLKLLNQLRTEVKTGENNFKWNLLKDELTRNKDVYGTPYSKQLLKQMMVIGAVVETGKTVFDAEMWGHVIHIPGLQMGEKGAQLGLNPAVGAAYKTITGANKTADDEFWMSRFMKSWLGQTGFPAIAHKMARLREEDIYKDNKLNYLFGVPKIGE